MIYRYYSKEPMKNKTYSDRIVPEKIMDFKQQDFCTEISDLAYGYVEYTEPLTGQEVAEYQLQEGKNDKETCVVFTRNRYVPLTIGHTVYTVTYESAVSSKDTDTLTTYVIHGINKESIDSIRKECEKYNGKIVSIQEFKKKYDEIELDDNLDYYYNVNIPFIQKKIEYQSVPEERAIDSTSYPTLEEAEEVYDKAICDDEHYKELELYYSFTHKCKILKTNYEEQMKRYAKENNIPEYQFYSIKEIKGEGSDTDGEY